MAKELAKMRGIRLGQREMRTSLKNRETANKTLRERIALIWTIKKEERTPELEKLISSLVEGRSKVREYQTSLRNLKKELKETNRAYDLSNED